MVVQIEEQNPCSFTGKTPIILTPEQSRAARQNFSISVVQIIDRKEKWREVKFSQTVK